MSKRLPVGSTVTLLTDDFSAEGAEPGCTGQILGCFRDSYMVEIVGRNGQRIFLSDVGIDDVEER